MAHLHRWLVAPSLQRMRHTPRSCASSPPRICTILDGRRAASVNRVREK